ncbi:hypothetical protein D7Z26_07335 [Cohnella endophytica]|uniref:Uncharacterized protein n=1 Tax=Cohnella endophytica TaxID=2419778 RepID=A0A494XWQ1_9BACL|nr:hypothetical protein [Cohnella endophytica]RKP55035.1 hypothetical protein D7Z26_07335 [Cohnella endophytica]
MNNETTNAEVDNNQIDSEEKWTELVKAVHHNSLVSLRTHFDDVEGQVLNQEVYGPVFVYQVKDNSGNGYACGFFLRELVAKFQSGSDAAQWMASFYFELMKTEGGKLLPNPPASEDEAKAIIDKVLVPQCIAAVQEEFAPEQVHAGLDWNQDHGPVFEAGFPSIRDGNNVCAFPLHLLYTHLLLNRDPADLLLQGMYKIREEHGME